LQPQISILLTLLIEIISSFLVVMDCGGYALFSSIDLTITHFNIFNLLFKDEHDILGLCQVFGPSDAVDFVQKLLNVRACFRHFCSCNLIRELYIFNLC
jgi:hypothetical protein